MENFKRTDFHPRCGEFVKPMFQQACGVHNKWMRAPLVGQKTNNEVRTKVAGSPALSISLRWSKTPGERFMEEQPTHGLPLLQELILLEPSALSWPSSWAARSLLVQPVSGFSVRVPMHHPSCGIAIQPHTNYWNCVSYSFSPPPRCFSFWVGTMVACCLVSFPVQFHLILFVLFNLFHCLISFHCTILIFSGMYDMQSVCVILLACIVRISLIVLLLCYFIVRTLR